MKKMIIVFSLLLPFLFSSPAVGINVADYTKAIEQSPADMKYKFYLLRGLAYRSEGNIDAAIKDFSISIKMRPTQDGYLRRGEMYFEKEVYTLAEEDFTSALDMNQSLEAYKLRGVTSLVLGNLDQAVADGTRIITMKPNTSESYNIRMEAYAQMGELEPARKDARRALELDRNNRVAAELLVTYPEKIELAGGAASRYRPKTDVNRYRVWANNKGFAFTLKPTGAEDGSTPAQPPQK
jgi:tetratricopeptide (TPR) repeat protein